MDNSHWQAVRCSDEFSGAYTLSGKAYGNLALQATLPGVKKPPCVASTFLEKFASITAVDLIQRKKLGSWKFFESHLTEARFEII